MEEGIAQNFSDNSPQYSASESSCNGKIILEALEKKNAIQINLTPEMRNVSILRRPENFFHTSRLHKIKPPNH